MKRLGIALVVSVLALFFSACANEKGGSPEKEMVHHMDGKGLQLIKNNCYACHNPNTKSHDDIIAPPLVAVKRHYINAYPTKEEFVREMSQWIQHPEEEMALMFGAVNRFNLMPQLAVSKEDAETISIYIFENEVEKPKWFAQHQGGMQCGNGGQEMGNWQESIALPDGKKWKSDAATLAHIVSLQKIGQSVSPKTIEEYHQVSTQFSKEIDGLMTDCKMEGPDHQALHKYLSPLMKKNDELAKVENKEDADMLFKEIQTQLNEYQNFFQK